MAGTTGHTLLSGIILFFLCEIFALSLAVFGGSIVDILESSFYVNGLFNSTWGPSSYVAYHQMVDIFYFTPYLMAGLGVVILILTIWHRHGSDVEYNDEDDYQNNF